MVGWWVLVGAVLAAGTAAVVVLWRAAGAEGARAADRFARRVDLALPPELVPVVARRLVRRRRANLVVACVAVVSVLAVAIWSLDADGAWGDGTEPAMAMLGAVAAVQLALAGAALAAQAGDLAHRGQEAPRASHLPRPGLDDYLSPLELWLARGLAATAVLTLAFLAADRPDRRGALGGVVAACLGMWGLIELTVRAVVRARPAASDVQSLAFDDALRADAVRRLLGTTHVLLLAAGLFVAQAGRWRAAGTALVGLYVAGLLAQSALSERGSARTHYRRRLWPTAAPRSRPCS
jgi:hypothetical protein